MGSWVVKGALESWVVEEEVSSCVVDGGLECWVVAVVVEITEVSSENTSIEMHVNFTVINILLEFTEKEMSTVEGPDDDVFGSGYKKK